MGPPDRAGRPVRILQRFLLTLRDREERLRRVLEVSRSVQDVRLIPGMLALWAVSAAVTWRSFPHVLALGAVGGALTTVLLAVQRTRREPDRSRGGFLNTALLSSVILVLGSALGLIRLMDPVGSSVIAAADAGAVRTVELVVTGPAEPSEPEQSPAEGDRCGQGCMATAVLQRIGDRGVSNPVVAQIRLRCSTACPHDTLAVGTRLEALVRLSRKPERPGRLEGTVLRAPLVLQAPSRLESFLGGIRTSFLQRSAAIPGEPGSLLEGMVLGERSRNGPGFIAVMTSTGLTHLTAVSGANCSIVFAAILLGARSLSLPRVPAAAAGLAGLGAFVILIGPDSSVLRAAVMSAAALGVLAGGHGARGIPLLCVSASCLLLTEPALSLDPGFALSVTATGGIVLAGRPMARLLSRIMPYGPALMLAIPLVAQTACSPLLVLLQPQLTPYAVPANLLAAPLVAPVTLLGMGALLLLPVSTVLGEMLFVPASWCTTAIWGIARSLAELPGAVLDWPPGPWGMATMASLGVLECAILWALAHPGKVAAAYRWLHRSLARNPRRGALRS
ncbi:MULTISPECIES: ComEC/Rec2 family competence protein [Arthrobacter]|uniref:ComEC/Rec2 family competence protein n=2 Tax=Arthrobacter TaxID=1663 RepID=A0ABU9KGL6_9MICC|nr:ComEC/Rec2 family competence protein [Arthrobacter sp. YJM1]MDP5226026.1 ComEC/Rec2 family competence protein [Arthrobacter sp. YJM1]